MRSAYLTLLSASVTLVTCAFTGPTPPLSAEEFLRGDANSDGQISISDALAVRRFAFDDTPVPVCLDAADATDDGRVDISDEIFLLSFVFDINNAAPPDAPFPTPGQDPTGDDLDCASSEITEPETTEDLVALGEASGAPGSTVEIPVRVTNTVPIDAFQLVIEYDPELFVPASGSRGVEIEGTLFEDATTWFKTVHAHPEDEVFTVGFVPDLAFSQTFLPPGEDTLAFKIVGEIPATAPEGSQLVLNPNNDGFGAANIRNELTHRGEARFVSVIPETREGLLRIVGDQTFFRGDSNGDLRVDVSDPMHTLNYLFADGPEPPCFDASDANDDGKLDISDPLMTLRFLFEADVASLPPPHPELGTDPTEDDMVCLGFTA